jgi:RNase H-fold protein (predicted Holliday junction resolvase)
LEAEGLLREAGRQPSREKGTVDETAAALILQRYLDRERK